MEKWIKALAAGFYSWRSQQGELLWVVQTYHSVGNLLVRLLTKDVSILTEVRLWIGTLQV
jgi:hypothetical protein